MDNKLKACGICQKQFPVQDLFPNALIRDNLFNFIHADKPGFTRNGYICFSDYREYDAKRYEQLLREEKGRLTRLEKEVIESLREQEVISQNTNEQYREVQTLGERFSDKLALFGGSWSFIISFIGVIIIWMFINTAALFAEPFDAYPFIFLNLVLSCLAAIQAPIILMSQNRQSAQDRIKADQDYLVNLKAELQIRQLNSRFDFFMKHHWQLMEELIKSRGDLQEHPIIEDTVLHR